MAALIEHNWTLSLGILGFLILWPISLMRRDASIVDFWWGPGIGCIAVALWWAQGASTGTAVLAILVPLVVWSLRLGVQLGLRRISEGVEDPRYASMRAGFSPGWWWKSLFVVFILQGLLQAIIGLSAFAGLANATDAEAPALALMLSAVALAAVAFQTVSDTQLDLYRRTVPNGGLLTSGLRRYVRYPSYSAEIVFWIAISGIALIYGIWWAPLSALLIVGLLKYVSGVTILEDRLGRTRTEFAAYRETVPALVPSLALLRNPRQKPADRQTG